MSFRGTNLHTLALVSALGMAAVAGHVDAWAFDSSRHGGGSAASPWRHRRTDRRISVAASRRAARKRKNIRARSSKRRASP